MKSYDKAFLTGCDQNTEWMLPWFIENFKKHNDTDLIVANFGMSREMIQYCKQHVSAVMNLTEVEENGWFKKPRAMWSTPAKKAYWLDTDCQVMRNLDSLFDLIEPHKLCMVEDHPWTERHKSKWFNSGVVGFEQKSQILLNWLHHCKENPNGVRGDQEVLHEMLNPIGVITYIKEIDHTYNYLRLDILDNRIIENPHIIHWTGPKGKDQIRSMMNA